MTTLIQQRTNNDCVLACIAMAAGKPSWEEAWSEGDLAEVVASKGISDYRPWLERHGLMRDEHWREVYVHGDSQGTVKAMLWGRRAILSVYSLNHNGGHHAVYWDGERILDPNAGIQGKQAFRFLSSVNMTRLYLFA